MLPGGYEREQQPMPRLGAWREKLDELLAANEGKSSRERLTLIRVFEALRALGYEGGYDAVRRYARGWRREQVSALAAAYVPLSFAPGEAYQFDWSYEIVLIGGTTVTVKVAHVRLCHSRMLFVRAYGHPHHPMLYRDESWCMGLRSFGNDPDLVAAIFFEHLQHGNAWAAFSLSCSRYGRLTASKKPPGVSQETEYVILYAIGLPFILRRAFQISVALRRATATLVATVAATSRMFACAALILSARLRDCSGVSGAALPIESVRRG